MWAIGDYAEGVATGNLYRLESLPDFGGYVKVVVVVQGKKTPHNYVVGEEIDLYINCLLPRTLSEAFHRRLGLCDVNDAAGR